MTNGVWSYSYDSQNRLSNVISNGVMVSTDIYDAESRRIGTLIASRQTVFLYDMWHIIRDIGGTASGNTAIDRFWGKDLSGSMQSAGGIGGLLAEHHVNGSFFSACDNLGNIGAYFDSNGINVANYEYDAFGRTTVFGGLLNEAFMFKFSTKTERVSHYAYGYRVLCPMIGRWISRDLIEERGGLNLFAFVLNNSFSKIDPFGLSIGIMNPIHIGDVIFENCSECQLKRFKVIPEDIPEGVPNPNDYLKDAQSGWNSDVDGFWMKGHSCWFKIPNHCYAIVECTENRVLITFKCNVAGMGVAKLLGKTTMGGCYPDSGDTEHSTDYPF